MRLKEILAEFAIADVGTAQSIIATTLSTRGGIPTYLDNRMLDVMRGDEISQGEAVMLRSYLRRLLEKGGRFLSWADRQTQLEGLPADTELDFRAMLYSQGAGRPYAWRGLECFKTVYELALYPMMLAEIRPRNIVELGAGMGGSAAWFLDMSAALGLDAVVHAVDLQIEDGAEGGLRTSRRDCILWLQEMADRRDQLASRYSSSKISMGILARR